MGVEEWKEIKGFEGRYKISSFGRALGPSNKILKPLPVDNGYYRYGLAAGGKVTYRSAHRLVALHFIPKVRGKEFVNHKDGNKANNSVENLEWVTGSENIQHSIDLGTFTNMGEGSHLSIYSIEEISEVCELLKRGMNPSEVSRKVKISRIIISRINRGRTRRRCLKTLGIEEFPINGIKN